MQEKDRIELGVALTAFAAILMKNKTATEAITSTSPESCSMERRGGYER